jgi:EF-P beta-lysylation protein EpmB
MVLTTKSLKPSLSWGQLLQQSITDPVELLRILQLPLSLLEGAEAAWQGFKLRVPRGFVARMEVGNPADPLLLQVLPIAKELDIHPGFSYDPLEEALPNPIPGLLHKYHGRVLLTATASCAINCRYCFRRHFPYKENNPGFNQWQQALDYIRADHSIKEVILSGGDPLLLSDAQLANFLQRLEAIPHVTTLRFHSRIPVVLPERITSDFAKNLQHSRLHSVMVLHCNHANECDENVAVAMATLKHAGVTLLNQSVLLKGINDDVNTLQTLSERLFAIGVLPYYLHVLDKVHGSAHFYLSDAEAIALMKQLTAKLPGYLVPKLVRETPGELNKTMVI